MPAGWGTDHVGFGQCKFHGGRLPGNRVAAAKKEIAKVTDGAVFMGKPLDMGPEETMLACVKVAAGHLAYATMKVAEVPEDEGFVETLMGKQLHPWARVQAECLDRLARFSKMAIDCGAEPKAVEMAKKYAPAIAEVLKQVFDDLNLTEDQKQLAPGLLMHHFGALEGIAVQVTNQEENGT